MLFICHFQSSHLLSLSFLYLHTIINFLILQAGSQDLSESRLLAVIVFSHLTYLIFQHTLDFVTHGFPAGLTEMNPNNVGRPANLFHQGVCILFTLSF